MASSDIDQKFLGRCAKQTAASNPILSGALYQLLGLSVLLSRKLYRARKLRKLDTTRDTKSLSLYHHIIWLSREGLTILETLVIPYALEDAESPECRVLSAKLRASFYHVFCLFHNQPPISQVANPVNPRLPAETNPQSPRQYLSTNSPAPGKTSNKMLNSLAASPNSREQRAIKLSTLRDPVASITSETSFLTNPYASGGGVLGTPPLPSLPPGLNPVPIQNPSAFLLPPLNFLPLTSSHFTSASAYAAAVLPGSHPLRLSVALEHAAFLWDCLHDHDGARRLARKALKDVYKAQEGMEDSEFEDAAELVAVLGAMMKRKSWEGTPKVPNTGEGSPIGQQHPPMPMQFQSHPQSPNHRQQQQQQPSPPAPVISSYHGVSAPVTYPQVPPSQSARIQPHVRTQSSPQSRRDAAKSSPVSPQRRRVSGGSRSSTGEGSQQTTPRAGGSRAGSGSTETTPRAPYQMSPRVNAGPRTERHR